MTESEPNGMVDSPQRGERASALSHSLARRAFGGAAELDEAVLTAITHSVIEIDDIEACSAAVLDLGPTTVLEALQNGARWDGFVERLTRPLPAAGIAVHRTSAHSPDARAVLRWLHLATGTAPLAMLRAVSATDCDLDRALNELVAAGVVRSTYPPDGSGARISLLFGYLGDAADELRIWALHSGGAELIPSMTVAVDRWVLGELSSASGTSTEIRALALRRHGLVALERLAAAELWEDAAGVAEALTPALAAVGLHRALHRGVRAVLDRASSATSASEELRSRFRSVSAELYFASGDLDLCRHLLDSVDVSPASHDNLRWRAQLTAATWAAEIDPAAVLSIVASHVLDGGSHLFAAEITLDLAARLIRDNRHEDATEVLAAAGGYAAVVDNDLLIARLHVTNAVLHSQTGDLRTGRQRLGAAYPIAAARGEYTFVHVVSACTGVDRVSDNSDGGAHLTEVAELLAGTALDVDHRSVVAVAVADHGPGWIGRRSGRTSPLLASVQSLYGSSISATVHDVEMAAPHATTAAALTDREDQVANLVAEGLSNTDIGSKLGISRWTVVSHLRNIMRKWECSSRVEVALKYRS